MIIPIVSDFRVTFDQIAFFYRLLCGDVRFFSGTRWFVVPSLYADFFMEQYNDSGITFLQTSCGRFFNPNLLQFSPELLLPGGAHWLALDVHFADFDDFSQTYFDGLACEIMCSYFAWTKRGEK